MSFVDFESGPEEFVNLQSLSRSKFEMVWHQFSTAQFPSHQFALKVCSVQFRARGPSASVQFSSFSSFHEAFRPWLGLSWLARFGSGLVQSIESPIVWEEQRSSSRSPPVEIPALRPVVCRLVGGIVHFADCLLVWGLCGVREQI